MSETKLQQNACNEKKKNAQRLYRYAHQLGQRLDLQLQNANEWKEFFDSETLLLRQKLKDTCEQLLLNGNIEISRRVEDLLWRKGFYDLIQKLRQDKKLFHSNVQLVALYNAHLDAANAFYHHLLFQIRDNFDVPVISLLDWLSNNDTHKRKIEEKANNAMDHMEWAVKSCQRCLVFLGDIARYRIDLRNDNALALAERYYHQAIWVNPENGMPHNQLGTLKQQANYHDCEVAYHYLRCLVSAVRFDGAEENLKRTFERNKCSMNQEIATVEGEGNSLVEQFLTEFLDLQENFRYERLHSTEFSKICQSVIEKFAEVLNVSVWKQITSDGQTDDGNGKGQICNFNDFQKRISDGLMVKIFVICIITVSDLFSRDSEIVSAAVAFIFTMLSKLLDFIARALAESPLSVSINVNENIRDAKSSLITSENEHQNGKDYLQIKNRKTKLLQKYRRRRRRRHLSDNGDSDVERDDEDNDENESNSDLSEGELLDQFLSSDENDDDGGDDDDNQSGASTDTESNGDLAHDTIDKIAKHRRENDRKKLQSLCQVGKLLSSHMQSTTEEMPRVESRSSLWSIGTMSDTMIDVSFDASLNSFTDICYLQTFKIMTDWLRYSGDEMDLFQKDLSCVWHKVAKALNELPSHQLLLVLLQSIRRRNNVFQLVDLKNAFSEQQQVLPEDKSLIGLPFLTSLHKTLDYDWDSKTNYAAIIQFVIRVQSLKSFGKYLSEKVHLFSFDKGTEKFYYGKETQGNRGADASKETESKMIKKTDGVKSENNQSGHGKYQNELMKTLAKQKLMHEVSELEGKMSLTSRMENCGMPPYLILDSQALCRHLSLIRSLSKSREFIMIVPIQVVQALDELKRYNPSAREAIKFLEEEFRQSSKWLRSQRDDESGSYDFYPGGKRKKNIAIEEWRFYQVVKCSLYFANKAGKPNMVSILTSRKEGSGCLGTRTTADALEACRKNGIEVEPLVDFYQRWVAKKNT